MERTETLINKPFDLAKKNVLSLCLCLCFSARGGLSPCAEFNFFSDPEAAYVVLASMNDIRLLPYEVCCRHKLSWVRNHLHKFCFDFCFPSCIFFLPLDLD